MRTRELNIYKSDGNYETTINIQLCVDGNIDKIKELVKKGHTFPTNAFGICVKYNHVELSKYVNFLCDDGESLLEYDAYICCRYGSLDILKYILSLGYLPNEELMKTVAHFNQIEIAKYLFSIGCKYDLETTNIAIERGHLNFLELLIEQGLIISNKTLKIACQCGHVDILLRLLNLGYKLKKGYSIYYHIKIENINKIIEIYHELELSGDYQEACRQNKCDLCYTTNIKKLWELETYEYNSYIQLLPRELVEDLEELLLL